MLMKKCSFTFIVANGNCWDRACRWAKRRSTLVLSSDLTLPSTVGITIIVRHKGLSVCNISYHLFFCVLEFSFTVTYL